ncbi:MAG: hypothetical protein FWD19_06495, partial [Defluviitaleaceae bacterium]|nr:hypothetical protein [Defluviitaleaceae bacterium]
MPNLNRILYSMCYDMLEQTHFAHKTSNGLAISCPEMPVWLWIKKNTRLFFSEFLEKFDAPIVGIVAEKKIALECAEIYSREKNFSETSSREILREKNFSETSSQEISREKNFSETSSQEISREKNFSETSSREILREKNFSETSSREIPCEKKFSHKEIVAYFLPQEVSFEKNFSQISQQKIPHKKNFFELRAASAADAPLIFEWISAFYAETLDAILPATNVLSIPERFVANKNFETLHVPQIFLLCASRPVAVGMLAGAGETARLNLIYVPRE